MAEAPENDPMPSSSSPPRCETKDSEGPTPEKRRKLEVSDKLEHRLGGILCCAVCLDLPRAAVYQCTNGHLMCAPCFTHLLADARLRDEAATCPNCRIEISKTAASRNLAVEKAVSELPRDCRFCAQVFPRHALQHHEDLVCDDRSPELRQLEVRPATRRWLAGLIRIVSAALSRLSPLPKRPRLTGCRYSCLGCGWRGPAHGAGAHERTCSHPARSAAEILPLLRAREDRHLAELRLHHQILDLLSYEKITFNDLQLKPYRTDEFVHKLYYETSRFTAFNHQWVVKGFVNNNQRDPTQSYDRELTYQVVLKSQPSSAVSVQWVALRGPYGEAPLQPALHHHEFCSDEAAPSHPLQLRRDDANRLLASKAIHFRLIMFLCTK